VAEITNTGQKIQVPGYLRFSKIIVYILYAWILFGVILLALRVFLLAFSANETTPFVKFVLNTSADFLEPFRGIWPPKPVGQTGYLDVASIFAIIVYLLIMWGFSALIHYIQSKIDAFVIEQKQLSDIRARQSAAPRGPVPVKVVTSRPQQPRR